MNQRPGEPAPVNQRPGEPKAVNERPGGPPAVSQRRGGTPPAGRPLAGPPPGPPLRAGDLLQVTAAASVQFTVRPIVFRLIRVLDRPTFDGWVWLDGYQLDGRGDAVARRSIFVQPAGLRRLTETGAAQPRRAPNAGHHAPAATARRSGSSRPYQR